MRTMSRHARCLSVSTSFPVISMYCSVGTTIYEPHARLVHSTADEYHTDTDRWQTLRIFSGVPHIARQSSSQLSKIRCSAAVGVMSMVWQCQPRLLMCASFWPKH